MKDEKKIKWLWLTQWCGITKSKVIKLISSLISIDNIFSSQREDYEKLSFLKDEDIEKLCNKDLEGAKAEYEKIKMAGAEIICYDEELFPKAILLNSNHPCVLYAKGRIENLNEHTCFSVVGARVPDEYGKKCAYEISKRVGSKNITIVSGMADGIDSFAHLGAIDGGGYTVAVLGCGVDVVYPRENTNLYRKILDSGMIISEYPMSTNPDRFRFPERNKIIASLSEATVVIQAKEKSGSLITADLAKKYGRKLFALPGNISSSLSMGTNHLISKGATVVSSVDDILDFYHLSKEEKIKDYKNLEEDEKKIVDLLKSGMQTIDEICEKTQIPVFRLYSLLLNLELKEFINKDDTERYSI